MLVFVPSAEVTTALIGRSPLPVACANLCSAAATLALFPTICTAASELAVTAANSYPDRVSVVMTVYAQRFALNVGTGVCGVLTEPSPVKKVILCKVASLLFPEVLGFAHVSRGAGEAGVFLMRMVKV